MNTSMLTRKLQNSQLVTDHGRTVATIYYDTPLGKKLVIREGDSPNQVSSAIVDMFIDAGTPFTTEDLTELIYEYDGSISALNFLLDGAVGKRYLRYDSKTDTFIPIKQEGDLD